VTLIFVQGPRVLSYATWNGRELNLQLRRRGGRRSLAHSGSGRLDLPKITSA